MIDKSWFTARRRGIATILSASLIAGAITGAAVLSDGYSAQQLDLDHASVWVSNSEQQVIGRLNTQLPALDTAVELDAPATRILQTPSALLVADSANARLDVIDPATAEPAESVALPPQAPELAIAGETLAVLASDTGELWLHPVQDAGGFDSTDPPSLSLGAGSMLAASDGGAVIVLTPEGGRLNVIDGSSGALEERIDLPLEGQGDYQLAVIGDGWAVLDRGERVLFVPGGRIDLQDVLAPASIAQLQSSSASGDHALIATGDAIISVPLGGGSPRQEEIAVVGAPARPVVVESCSFAAWSGGALWRDCGGGANEILPLEGMSGRAALEFAVNGDHVVLNDTEGGASWAAQARGELVDNWDGLVHEREESESPQPDDAQSPPELERTQRAPVAVDDEFGVRPGRTTALPVLLNDYDANGDALVIDSVAQIDETLGRLELVAERQRVQLMLVPDAQGVFSFSYTISDGRGGTASATVTVTVRAPGENSPPIQVRSSTAVVETGGAATVNVLGDWVDPDGDPVYLVSASTAAPDTVTHRPSGSVIFSERGGVGAVRTAALVVSDGLAEAAGALTVEVHPSSSTPLNAESFAVIATAGDPVTVAPLSHVRGGSGTVRLNAVPARPGSVISPDFDKGTFSFRSEQVRTHLVEYVVADANGTASGVVRIEVQPRPDAGAKPITVPKTLFVRTLSSQAIDVTLTDVDPAGGVLLLTAIEETPASAGIRAEIVEQRAVRVTLTAPLTGGTAQLGYTVSNGVASAEGTVTIIEIPPPQRPQVPVAVDDVADVRVGAAIDIPVLANDYHPDGDSITLSPQLVQEVGTGGGLLFVSGSVLRYLAPAVPGVYTAVYEITGPGGGAAQAQLTLNVREVVDTSNRAPSPRTVTARAFAGDEIEIAIPLEGIDPDGDPVQLLGQETSPERGAVTAVGDSSFTYRAGDYSAGTDEFRYTVADGLGARATGLVRVGIVPRTGALPAPVAVEDHVAVRPGRSVLVPVLENDIDPAGTELVVVAAEPGEATVQAEIVEGDAVRVTPPDRAGRYGVVYTIENRFGGRSSNYITVVVDPEAPLARPVVRDTALELADILDRDEVDVDVLANVFFADGPVSQLRLSLVPGFSANAEITDDGTVRVAVAQRRQVIPFAVAHPADTSIVSYAFIKVPGLADALPQLDRTAPPLTVVSGDELIVPLNDRVISVGGSVRITDTARVVATHSDGSNPVVDSETLRFVSAPLYFGPASITVEVTDGRRADDPEGRVATLVVPITVMPQENQPPQFRGALVDFEPGQERTFDLLRLTTYPYPHDLGELRFSILDPRPSGFDVSLSERTLTVRAHESTPKGTAAAVSIGVADAAADGTSGRIRMRVVASSRPLAKPAPDTATVKRGGSTSVDVLANDLAGNPFPGSPLTVTAIRGIDGASLPAGITVAPGGGGSVLAVSASAQGEPIDATLQYRVEDATRDPERAVWGTVTISVQDVPGSMTPPVRAAGAHQDGSLTLQLTAPPANNSPIVRYEVSSNSNGGYRHDCGATLRCTLTDLVPGARYEFVVVAVNGIGASQPSAASAPLGSDYLPAAPARVTATATAAAPSGGAVDVSWAAVPDPSPGSAVIDYVIIATGADGHVVRREAPRGTTATNMVLRPGVDYTVTVHARNGAHAGAEEWRRGSAVVRPVGPPSPTEPAPSAASLPDGSGRIVVQWGPSRPNGAASVTYSVARFDAGAALPAACSPGSAKPGQISGAAVSSGWVDSDTSDGAGYRYVVYSDNGLYCTVSASPPVESKRPPGEGRGSVSVQAHGDTGQFDVRVDALGVASGTAVRYEARLGGGAWRPVAVGDWLTSAADASVYGVAQRVEIRGCRDSGSQFCGAASSPMSVTPVNTRVASMTTCTPGELPVAAPPANANSGQVTYRFSYADAQGVFGAFAFDERDRVPVGATQVRVRATVSLGGERYTDPAFGGAFACQ
ncbi:Ig-like domain-containing protein [Ruicaihuangia caeni]|uniref:Ig-like domain-containing protein n=1 Tax=Ruicaihuangia caeni TaxID=3042517 RepID=A0AAW6T569_9MICO|nr:Ig-like domain-containing protein [Klugiella sp. YN-L-19]MDI2097489.1 Ig-like domain-containing protein [Klugiella sp. YN-L-19]